MHGLSEPFDGLESRPGAGNKGNGTSFVRNEGLLPGMPSQDIASFIGTSFRSVWALELLCFLREHRDRELSHIEMVNGLRGSDLVVSQSLASLAAAGLILVDDKGSARYAPATEQLDLLVDEARTLYGRSPDKVRRMIIAGTSPGLSAFADAFKLRKD